MMARENEVKPPERTSPDRKAHFYRGEYSIINT